MSDIWTQREYDRAVSLLRERSRKTFKPNIDLRARRLSEDTETTGLNPWKGDRPYCFSLCDPDGETDVIEFPVNPWTREVYYDANPAGYEFLGNLLASSRYQWTFYNSKFDIRMNVAAGLPKIPVGKFDDAFFASHACNTLEPNRELKTLDKKYLGGNNEDEKQLKAAVAAVRQRIIKWCKANPKKGRVWNFTSETKEDPDGAFVKEEYESEPDYWVPAAAVMLCKRLMSGLLDRYDRALDKLCAWYAGRDAERTQLLWMMYEPIMDEQKVRHTYDKEMQLWELTYAMEEAGVRVYPEVIAAEQKANKLKATRHLLKLRDLADDDRHDPAKPAEVADVLFKKMRLTVRKRTKKTKKPAVNIEALQGYMDVEYVRELFGYRAAMKANSSFFDNYERNMVDDDLRENCKVIHADFQQVGPSTGRWACRNPNLQNVPDAFTTRSIEPIQARNPFGPRVGDFWFHWDYEQIEVRIFADLSQEPGLLQAIKSGRDLHTECANKAWGGENNPACIRQGVEALELFQAEPGSEPIRDLWKKFKWNRDRMRQRGAAEHVARLWLDQFDYDIVAAERTLEKTKARAKAKMILFSKIYGGGPGVLMRLLQCSWDDGALFLADYSRAFPRIDGYIDELTEEARNNGYIETLYERKVHVDPEFAYRCVNYKTQGSAADLIKDRMYAVWLWLREQKFQGRALGRMLLTIHDEVVLELNKNTPGRTLQFITQKMEDHGGRFGLPTPTKLSVTQVRWNEKMEVLL